MEITPTFTDYQGLCVTIQELDLTYPPHQNEKESLEKSRNRLGGNLGRN